MLVARTVGLCRDATRTHAYKGTIPIDEVEDGYTDSQRTDCRNRVTQVARYHRADDSHDGNGDVGDDVGYGYA